MHANLFDIRTEYLMFVISQRNNWTPWRNGSASDSRSEGCVFESRRGQDSF